MNKKDILKEKIIKSNIAENLKAFLLFNIDKFNDEQVDWLVKNL